MPFAGAQSHRYGPLGSSRVSVTACGPPRRLLAALASTNGEEKEKEERGHGLQGQRQKSAHSAHRRRTLRTSCLSRRARLLLPPQPSIPVAACCHHRLSQGGLGSPPPPGSPLRPQAPALVTACDPKGQDTSAAPCRRPSQNLQMGAAALRAQVRHWPTCTPLPVATGPLLQQAHRHRLQGKEAQAPLFVALLLLPPGPRHGPQAAFRGPRLHLSSSPPDATRSPAGASAAPAPGAPPLALL
ncbi:hypothetical protein NDU88_001482 [Pleurodeles waltl]|uniref:Uncharacterized protein n=1 Tax=Pleurodeles waltl TaxID=8319 RepID=A0AAV7RBR7_PLEWA|nr:hypothetical protein NDU88_001482 [Pleurodeles waltl]